MERRNFIGALSLTGVFGLFSPKTVLSATTAVEAPNRLKNDREYWYKLLYKIASPVVENLANGTLVKNMPLITAPKFDSRSPTVSYLEAVGRT